MGGFGGRGGSKKVDPTPTTMIIRGNPLQPESTQTQERQALNAIQLPQPTSVTAMPSGISGADPEKNKQGLGRRNWGFSPAELPFLNFFRKKSKKLKRYDMLLLIMYLTNNFLTIVIKQIS